MVLVGALGGRLGRHNPANARKTSSTWEARRAERTVRWELGCGWLEVTAMAICNTPGSAPRLPELRVAFWRRFRDCPVEMLTVHPTAEKLAEARLVSKRGAYTECGPHVPMGACQVPAAQYKWRSRNG